jgi:hypothetical protein
VAGQAALRADETSVEYESFRRFMRAHHQDVLAAFPSASRCALAPSHSDCIGGPGDVASGQWRVPGLIGEGGGWRAHSVPRVTGFDPAEVEQRCLQVRTAIVSGT